MRPVKNASVTKKPDTDAGAFRLHYFRAQYKKKGFDVIPADAAPNRALKKKPRDFQMLRFHVSIHSRPIRRLTPQPTARGRADCPSLEGGVTEKDFIGFAVLSTPFFPLKGEVSNHKGIFDENRILFFDVISRIFPS